MHAQCSIAHRRKNVLILKLKAGPISGVVTPDPPYCFMQEIPIPPGRKNKHRIRATVADLCDLARIVGLADLRIDLTTQLALVEPLEAVQRVRPAG